MNTWVLCQIENFTPEGIVSVLIFLNLSPALPILHVSPPNYAEMSAFPLEALLPRILVFFFFFGQLLEEKSFNTTSLQFKFIVSIVFCLLK